MTATLPTSRLRRAHHPAPVLARLRGLLVDRLGENAEQAAGHDATVRQLSGETDADSTIERELAMACAARAREAIEEARDALDRLDRGIYGTCQACGEPIAIERLEAIPHARLCIACPRSRPLVHR